MKILNNKEVQALEEEIMIMSALGIFNNDLQIRAKEIIATLNSAYRSGVEFKLELINGGKS